MEDFIELPGDHDGTVVHVRPAGVVAVSEADEGAGVHRLHLIGGGSVLVKGFRADLLAALTSADRPRTTYRCEDCRRASRSKVCRTCQDRRARGAKP